VALTLLIAACGGDGSDPSGDQTHRLPHLSAPLDTIQIIETTADSGLVEMASEASLEEPGWMSLSIRGIPHPKDLRFSRYENRAFGYSIAYPDTLLRMVQPVGENRGMEFASSDGSVRMLVYAVEASTREDLDAQYRAALSNPDVEVTYRARDQNWYIVSGQEGAEIFYEKSFSEDGVLKTFRIEYPAAEKAYYDAVTAMMSASFGSSSGSVGGEVRDVAAVP